MKHLLLGMMLLCTFAASAGMDPQLLKQRIEQRLGVQVYLVDATPIPGLFMLGTSQGPLYADAKGDYVLQGIMLDLGHDMKNLTMLGQRQQRQRALTQIGERRMQLKAVPERHSITLFTDLTCRSCRTSLDELPILQAQGVSVQLLPALGTFADLAEAQARWCDPALFSELSLSDRLPAAGCNEILAHHIGLSQWLGIKALPSWVLPNGDLVRGYQSPEQLLKILDHINAPANPSSSAS
ncbi:disulfide isomerase DsbC N-terminal domain-containing protein [Aeromonas bestiarum]|uniref:disulfide isomerase DsbC N-terminal domain-containing protein n=1 Tax=Aeromonas bestiarum TaxID=105751 RepID=UPI0005B85525|nr:disulfide isomerase DsbC N-terminal domain-containing protein [Aeromonas bestiarum]